jgi:hypothetical protein
MATYKRDEIRSCEIWCKVYLLIIIAYLRVVLDCIFYMFIYYHLLNTTGLCHLKTHEVLTVNIYTDTSYSYRFVLASNFTKYCITSTVESVIK